MMSRYSARAFTDFKNEIGADAGYRKVGYLFLVPAEGWSAWQTQVKMQRELGATVELLSIEALEVHFPNLSTAGLGGGSLGLDDGVVDPHAVTMGYVRAARARGAALHLQTEVRGLSFQQGRWRVETNAETFHADTVISGAGACVGRVAELAGLEVPVYPYRRNVYATGPLPDYPHPSPLMIDQATGVWLRSEGARFIMGLVNEHEPPSENQSVDWAWLEHLLERAPPRFPFLEHAGLDAKTCWAGLYAMTPDHLPILGEAQSHPEFFNACGFSGYGVQHSPATGHILASEVCGETHDFDLEDFRLERFVPDEVGIGRGAPGDHAERNVV